MLDKIYFKFAWLRWKRRQETSIALRHYFKHKFDIDVGLYSYGCFDRWRMPGPIRIGRYCSFGSSVRVVDANHPMDSLTTHPICYDPAASVIEATRIKAIRLIIEDDVWVGHNSVILPSCKYIGRGAIIGAGSIVTRDVAPYSVVAGNPARLLRHRFDPQVIAAIEASKWWQLSIPQLREEERANKLISSAVAAVLPALAAIRQGADET